MKYKKGMILLCIKTFYMKDSTVVAFTKGKKYKLLDIETSPIWSPYVFIDDNSTGIMKHTLNDKILDEYFEPIRRLKLERILNG